MLLAYDFGASSGRAMLGEIEDGKLKIQEIHRFNNDPVVFSNHIQWDFLRLCYEVKQGLLKCKNSGFKIESIGVDTWGVDFGILDKDGELISNPYTYRDIRTKGMIEECFKIVPEKELFQSTGCQTAIYNTIYQLISLIKNKKLELREGETLLLMPDLFNYMLTGEKYSEYTEVTTTQLYDYEKGDWNYSIIKKLGIKENIFTKIIKPGEVVGTIRKSLLEELNIEDTKVIAVGGHDTASAAIAVPYEGDDHVFISSGTWSLLGIENEKALTSEEVLKYGFTNEGSATGKVLLLKNIMGLWIVQECRRAWIKEGIEIGFAEMVNKALEVENESYIDPDDELFYGPNNMPNKVKEFCKRTNQKVPETMGEIVRCVEESLAFKYRWSIEKLEEITERKINGINMVGGGIQDKLLCQVTANATGRTVFAGPVEATAIGNIMIQAISLGKVKDLAHAKEIIRNSFEIKEYTPKEEWDNKYKKYLKIQK